MQLPATTAFGHTSGWGDATSVDSVVIEWPSGLRQAIGRLPIDEFINVREGETPIGVANEDELTIGGGIAIGQNYPNPFSSRSAIPLELSEPAYVTLELFDVTGGRVGRPVIQNFGPGRHQVEIAGDALVDGVYFYRMSVGRQSEVRKIIVRH